MFKKTNKRFVNDDFSSIECSIGCLIDIASKIDDIYFRYFYIVGLSKTF